jgi:glycolate dehydrogenase FAD-binding subunit
MSLAVESVHSELATLLGDSRMVSDPAVCAAWSVDGKIPQYVVYPTSAELVATVLRCAAQHDLAVIPCRNATKLGAGNLARRYDLALCLKEMNQVWHYEPADLTITVEPGMKFGDFQHFVGRHGLWLPLDPRGGARASLGGILATNSTGPLRLHYGTPRDMLLGMKVATSEGKVIKTGGRVVKNVAGYDLGKLLVGSHGTLGVIVEASLKLYPLPPQRATMVLGVGSFAAARELRRRLLRSPLAPLRAMLLDPSAAALVRGESREDGKNAEPEVWLELGASPRVIARCERELGELSRDIATRLSRWETWDAEPIWTRVADPCDWLQEDYPALVVLKAALPLAGVEDFLAQVHQEAEAEHSELAGFSQMGAGIVHLCVLAQKFAPEMEGSVKNIRKAAEGFGGSLVLEECPTELKSRVEVWGPVGDDFEAMRRLKAVWDPKGVLSPGRFMGWL